MDLPLHIEQPPVVPPKAARTRRVTAIQFMLLLVIAFLALGLFVNLHGVFEFDVWVTRMVQYGSSPAGDVLMGAITTLGNAGTLIAVGLIGGLYFWILGLRYSAALAVLSLLSYPLNVWIKDIVERHRPTSALVHIVSPAGGFSFPSGHAMITFCVYGSVAYLAWVNIKSPYRKFIPVIAGLIIFLVGLSRIYLGVHWFSDVFGGWIAGAAFVLLVAEAHKIGAARAAR